MKSLLVIGTELGLHKEMLEKKWKTKTNKDAGLEFHLWGTFKGTPRSQAKTRATWSMSRPDHKIQLKQTEIEESQEL